MLLRRFIYKAKEVRMKRSILCLLVVLCWSSFALSALVEDPDFIDEKGKALKNFKVVPGSRRDKVDYHNVEQEAGRAVLKLLDAKIGKKVNDAAKEVTDFLNDAVGHHAQQRTKDIQSDKQKEMSLLHLGAKKVLDNKDEENKPKKNKDGSFLVHFKVPYIVTPVDEKKKTKPKKYHHKHGKKPHLKKYHHRILHHGHHHHHHHHPAHAADASKLTPQTPQAPYNPQAPQAPPSQPNYNAIDLSFNGYNWTYQYSNDTSSDMIPCQGNCMDPCTTQCSMRQDCCCCDPNMMAQTQVQAAAPPAAPVYPPIQPMAPMAPPPFQPPPMPAFPQSQCPSACKRNCFTYCPRDCCGVAGKRDKVTKKGAPDSEEETTNKVESDEASGDERVSEEETERQHKVEDDIKIPQEKNEEQEDSGKSKEQADNEETLEGSSESKDDNENDD